ncbi:MAG: peptidoglycan-binding domain-containing protein [Paracoccus sp. (in: a-proteobacteria)]|nr:peptidoglycan-binding domain-containing protein [Paracoccus sp. (in: a-proteobacteria)]
MAMRHLAMMVLAGWLPVQALAEDAVIRLEAKRSAAAAAEAAASWAERFDNVVTLPLPGGWTGIALGPMPRADAVALLTQLREARQVPGDAFVSQPPPDTVLLPANPTAQTAGADLATAPAVEGASDMTQQTVTAPLDPPAEQGAASEPASPAVPEGRFLRLEAFEAETDARAALADWQAEFGDAWLWTLPDGWFALAIGPMTPQTASAWEPVLKAAEVIPSDAMIVGAKSLGVPLVEGAAPDLPQPDEPRPLPSLIETQRALRWAGHYTGQIDGKDGPMTQAAIRAEIASGRRSTDPGTAIARLIEAREAWRAQMGLTTLRDTATGLKVEAPMSALVFDRAERALSIYGPANDSGAALILFSQEGGQQELLDMAGLITALGWVHRPEREIRAGHVALRGANEDHIGQAEGRLRDGRAEGWVLIWPANDPQTQRRLAAELSDSLSPLSLQGDADQEGAIDAVKGDAGSIADDDDEESGIAPAAPLD